jgi:hypothetical protein
MKTEAQNDQALIQEALSILSERMSPSKLARLVAALRLGSGDYAETRHKIFEGETVDRLYQKILARREKGQK